MSVRNAKAVVGDYLTQTHPGSQGMIEATAEERPRSALSPFSNILDLSIPASAHWLIPYCPNTRILRTTEYGNTPVRYLSEHFFREAGKLTHLQELSLDWFQQTELLKDIVRETPQIKRLSLLNRYCKTDLSQMLSTLSNLDFLERLELCFWLSDVPTYSLRSAERWFRLGAWLVFFGSISLRAPESSEGGR